MRVLSRQVGGAKSSLQLAVYRPALRSCRKFSFAPVVTGVMGELIVLTERLADRSRRAGWRRSAFFFDLAYPFSYLVAERVERELGEVDWVPAPMLESGAPTGGRWVAAERRARALRLPLVWPERRDAPAPGTLRAALYAAEVGAAARFALAAGRLRFCGGFELDDPETLAEAAAAAGLDLDRCLAAARDATRDGILHATARGLRRRGVSEAPALAIGGQLFHGADALDRAALVCRTGWAPAG